MGGARSTHSGPGILPALGGGLTLAAPTFMLRPLHACFLVFVGCKLGVDVLNVSGIKS